LGASKDAAKAVTLATSSMTNKLRKRMVGLRGVLLANTLQHLRLNAQLSWPVRQEFIETEETIGHRE
jgi:hypothetical protein